MEKPITNNVEKVPDIERNATTMTSNSTPYMAGINVIASVSPASAKALFSIDMPDSAMWRSGNSSVSVAASSRATPTA